MNSIRDDFTRARIEDVDKNGVYRAYMDWTSLARKGLGVDPRVGGGPFRRAFVLGMGGSAAGGDIIAGWLSTGLRLEFEVFKGAVARADMKDSLAIACSASGDTEETIAMMKTAVQRGATVVSISSGGALMRESAGLGVSHIAMPRIVAPRYMLPFIVFSCLAVLNKGANLDCRDEADEAIASLEETALEVDVGTPAESNLSKRLAERLVSKTPVVYGDAVARGVGIRFKNAMNENAKKQALFDAAPDLFHNGVESWGDPSGEFLPVLLRHSDEGERAMVKMDALAGLLTEGGRGPVQVRGRGKGILSQLVTMAYVLDMASYYTAIGLGRDPFPTPTIDRLKRMTT